MNFQILKILGADTGNQKKGVCLGKNERLRAKKASAKILPRFFLADFRGRNPCKSRVFRGENRLPRF
jgi:hypothetical protein